MEFAERFMKDWDDWKGMKMKRIYVFIAVCMALVVGCGEQRTKFERLTEAQIRINIQESIHALRTKNLSRVLLDIDPNWEMVLTVELAGQQQTHVLNKDQYHDVMKATLKDWNYILLSVSDIVITISEDGQSATVSSSIQQELAYREQIIKSYGVQTNTIRLINGFAMNVKSEGFTKQEIRSTK